MVNSRERLDDIACCIWQLDRLKPELVKECKSFGAAASSMQLTQLFVLFQMAVGFSTAGISLLQAKRPAMPKRSKAYLFAERSRIEMAEKRRAQQAARKQRQYRLRYFRQKFYNH